MEFMNSDGIRKIERKLFARAGDGLGVKGSNWKTFGNFDGRNPLCVN